MQRQQCNQRQGACDGGCQWPFPYQPAVDTFLSSHPTIIIPLLPRRYISPVTSQR